MEEEIHLDKKMFDLKRDIDEREISENKGYIFDGAKSWISSGLHEPA